MRGQSFCQKKEETFFLKEMEAHGNVRLVQVDRERASLQGRGAFVTRLRYKVAALQRASCFNALACNVWLWLVFCGSGFFFGGGDILSVLIVKNNKLYASRWILK